MTAIHTENILLLSQVEQICISLQTIKPIFIIINHKYTKLPILLIGSYAISTQLTLDSLEAKKNRILKEALIELKSQNNIESILNSLQTSTIPNNIEFSTNIQSVIKTQNFSFNYNDFN